MLTSIFGSFNSSRMEILTIENWLTMISYHGTSSSLILGFQSFEITMTHSVIHKIVAIS